MGLYLFGKEKTIKKDVQIVYIASYQSSNVYLYMYMSICFLFGQIPYELVSKYQYVWIFYKIRIFI